MKKAILILLAICLNSMTFGQVTENQKMIELAKIYKDFMFRNEPSKKVLKDLSADVPENLKTATAFIGQTITTKNKLCTQPFLARPNDKVLKQIYIIAAISQNLREENRVDNNKLIDSLSAKDIPVYELVDNYYNMVFTAIGNKNQPFDLSKVDLTLNDYNLKDDTEKGILVLQAISYCGTTIWGYMNVVKPANTKTAYEYIKKFPEINSRPYFQYTDFYFPDFEIIIDKDKGIQSYKGYYLNKYFETLLYHLICMSEQGGSSEEKNDLLLGSILKEEKLYKYTKHQKTLEQIFMEKKRD